MFEVPGSTAPSILVAALAPLMLRLAGELTEGTITYWADERAVAEHVVPRIAAAATQAGRPPPRVVAGVPVVVCATKNIDDVKERAARLLSVYEGIPTYQRILGRGGARGPVDVCAIGDEATVAARLGSYASAGATDFMAAPMSVDADPASLRPTLDVLAGLAASAS
jgi:alkanesulfonate monooxygenase SsuD/methylene tetrahydromethanopterin reductase-like flavin-dependent oxidoreductase (luciferase family)